MRISRWLKLMLLTGSVTISSGCTWIYFPYFLNHTDESVELTFKGTYFDNKSSSVLYKNEILAINKKTYKKLNDSLYVNNLEDNKILLIVPPKSTVLIPKWATLFPGTIILKQKNKLDSISIYVKDSEVTFQTKRYGFPSTYLYFYDYK